MNPVEIAAREVEALLASGRAAEAVEPCRRIVLKAPRDPAAQFLMSRVFMAAGKPDQALHYAQSAAGLVPGEVSLQLHHARLLIICGRSERALDVLAKAARLDDVSPAVAAMRAGALLELNRCMEASRRRALPPNARRVMRHRWRRLPRACSTSGVRKRRWRSSSRWPPRPARAPSTSAARR